MCEKERTWGEADQSGWFCFFPACLQQHKDSSWVDARLTQGNRLVLVCPDTWELQQKTQSGDAEGAVGQGQWASFDGGGSPAEGKGLGKEKRTK